MSWKPKPIRFSLCAQLILCYMVVSGAVFGVVAYFYYHYATYLVKQSNEKSILQQLSQTDYNIDKITTDVSNLANMLLMDDGVQQYLLGNYDNQSDLASVEGRNGVIRTIDNYLYSYGYVSSIYFFCANGDEIGSNGQYTCNNWGANGQNAFVESDLFRRAMAQFPRLVYGGGRRLSDFSPQMNAKDANPYQVSLARGVRPINRSSIDAVLVLNVKESYISSLYASNGAQQFGQITIVGEAGRVVSSGRADELNLPSPYWGRIAGDTQSGGFTTTRDGASVQVVYYRMQSTGWYLIDEVSLQSLNSAAAIGQIAAVSICLAGILLVFVISYLWVRKITHPINLLSLKMGDVSRGHPGVTLDLDMRNEVGALIHSFNDMSVNTAQLIQKNNRIQEEKTRLEIEVLQAQINPHFIYNTLNMIKWMATMIGARNIEECVVALGNLLGPAFRERRRVWTLAQERDYLENYIKITNWRFGNLIRLHIQSSESLDVFVPKFVLQPVVENSVKHGIAGSNALEITIQVQEEGEALLIRVSDDGKGIESERLEMIRQSLRQSGQEMPTQADSVGLYNVNRRIRLNYGERYGIDIESVAGQRTTTSIRLPRIVGLPDARPEDAPSPQQQ